MSEQTKSHDEGPWLRDEDLWTDCGYGADPVNGREFVRRNRKADPAWPRPAKIGKFNFTPPGEWRAYKAAKRVR